MSFYRDNGIYVNEDLTTFIESLECKYNVINYRDKYEHSVNFSENKDVPFHQWFKYREGFSGTMIKDLISDSGISENQVVLDPFNGSGTTTIVAQELGYSSVGIDVNPMSVFICKVKLSTYPKDMLGKINKETQDYNFEIANINLEKYKTKYNGMLIYFSPKNFKDLMAVKKYVDSSASNERHEILKVAYLSIIELVSDRKKDGNGLKKRISKVDNVFKVFRNKVAEICIDLKTKKNVVENDSIFGSAMNLSTLFSKSKLAHTKEVGTIIFSPPYPNSFDYFETYKLELVLGDFAESISEIKTFRNEAIRSFISVSRQVETEKYIDLIAEEIENAIPHKENMTGKKDTRTRKVPNMVRGYFYDMRTVIRSCAKILKPGGKVYIVVDQSSYIGKVIPSDILLAHLSESEGFIVRDILNCRNSRTSTQQLKQYPYLKSGLRESIVILERK